MKYHYKQGAFFALLQKLFHSLAVVQLNHAARDAAGNTFVSSVARHFTPIEMLITFGVCN